MADQPDADIPPAGEYTPPAIETSAAFESLSLACTFQTGNPDCETGPGANPTSTS